jgi:hypothetical protein
MIAENFAQKWTAMAEEIRQYVDVGEANDELYANGGWGLKHWFTGD